MQNLDVEETIQKNGKTRFEIRKELEESITNGKSNKNIEIKEKVNNVVTREDAAKVVQEFEQIIKNKKPTLYGWPTIKGKYYKNLKKKNAIF